MISADALQVGFLSSLTIVNEGSSLRIVNEGLSLMIVNEGLSLTIVNKGSSLTMVMKVVNNDRLKTTIFKNELLKNNRF